MALPVSFLSLTMNDNTLNSAGQPTSTNTEVPITTITAGNFTAQSALWAALINGLEGITNGNPAKSSIVANRTIISSAPAASTEAQREKKFLLRYHGVTLNQKFQVSIGTADLSQLIANSEFIDLTAGAGAALKSAFEAVVVSPDNSSEAVVLDSVQYVGRNT